LKGKRVILVDDGVATGKTVLMALEVVRSQRPKEIIVALPVVPESVLPRLQNNADKVISLQTPTLFQAVGAFYKNFKQVSDDEAIALLTQAKR
jgi:predicted phosphoribosyltransferase